jgi:hypothetical protein
VSRASSTTPVTELVEVHGGAAVVHGLGQAYPIHRVGRALQVEILIAEDRRVLSRNEHT